MAIRVLHIISSLELGGAQVCVKYLVENAGSGVEPFVYPLRCGRTDISVNGEVAKLAYPNYDVRKFFSILRLCREHRIDIIHAHLEKPILGGLLASYFCNSHVVIHEHGPIFRSGWRQKIYRLGLRLLAGRATVVLAVSEAVAKELAAKAKVKPDRIRVVHNAVNLDRFKPDEQKRRQFREQLGAGKDDIVIGYAGRLAYVKGVDLLVEAMGLLAEKSSRYLLVLVGQGRQREYLEKLTERLGISRRVKFLGFCDNVAEIMTAFDIGVVPSRQEAWGIVALELMSMKVPLVCSGVEGLAEIATDDETALLTSRNTAEEIAGCIERLTGDEALRGRLAQAGRQKSEEFSVGEYVRKIEQIYAELVS